MEPKHEIAPTTDGGSPKATRWFRRIAVRGLRKPICAPCHEADPREIDFQGAHCEPGTFTCALCGTVVEHRVSIRVPHCWFRAIDGRAPVQPICVPCRELDPQQGDTRGSRVAGDFSFRCALCSKVIPPRNPRDRNRSDSPPWGR